MSRAEHDDELFVTARYQPLAALDYGTTGDETRRPEPLSGRLRREVPDRAVERPDAANRYPGRYGWADDTAREPLAGRLVADDEGAHEDTTAEEVALAYDDEGDYSAEELAVHVVESP